MNPAGEEASFLAVKLHLGLSFLHVRINLRETEPNKARRHHGPPTKHKRSSAHGKRFGSFEEALPEKE